LILLAVSTNPSSPIIVRIDKLPEIASKIDTMKWEGSPNHLSKSHTIWDVVEAVDNATRGSYLNVPNFLDVPEVKQIDKELEILSSSATSEFVIRSRRSAVDFTGGAITLNQFYHILWHLTPKLNHKPWSSLSQQPQINIFFFIYNVTDLQPGLYALIRNEELDELHLVTKHARFMWELVKNVYDIQLYMLKLLDNETTGKTSFETSCHQSIATHTNGAFSVGMFANLEKIIGQESFGPNGYLAAHYECGLIGHILYLEAHSMGFGATGMGCFLDDLSRQAFGLQNEETEKIVYYPLYHFAIGIPDKTQRYKLFDYRRDMFDGVLQECVDCTLR